MDNPLAQSNPLVQDIKAAFADALMGLSFGSTANSSIPRSSAPARFTPAPPAWARRDVRGGHFIAIVKNMLAEQPTGIHPSSASNTRWR